MFIKLNRLHTTNNNYYLSEVRINVSHILYLSEDVEASKMLHEGKIDIGLSKAHRFTKIKLSTGYSDTVTVVGSPEVIEHKISLGTKRLLRG